MSFSLRNNSNTDSDGVKSEGLENNLSTLNNYGSASITSIPKERGIFHKFADSFKEMKIDEELNTEGLSDLEIANLKVSSSPMSKSLKPRHIQLIALGGCIGTGLFIGTGTALRTGGPASLLILWAIVGSMLYCVMNDLSEMTAAFPSTGAFISYNVRFTDPSWGFAMAWNYCLMWLIVLPLEIIAASLTLQFWNSDVNSLAWVVIFYVFICVLNLFGLRGYGEMEFVCSLIKLAAILGFLILSIVLICGGGPTHDFIGSRYWHDPGAIHDGFKGVCTVFVTAAYSLAGTELSCLAVAESLSPRKAIPKGIKQVFWRILLFYMITLMLLGFLVPYNSSSLLGGKSSYDANVSPFVIAIKNARIKGLPSVMNAVILIAVLSVGNAATYGCSRTLCSLAAQGLAPKIFAYVDRQGRPLMGFLASAFIGLLCFICANAEAQSKAFTWLLALSGLSSLFTWGSISFSRIQFRRAWKYNGRDVSELPFVSQTGLLGSVYSIIINILLLLAQFWIALFPIGGSPDAEVFFENYLSAVVVLVLYLGHKIYSRSWGVILHPKDIDIHTGFSGSDPELMKMESEEEKRVLATKPFYYRWYQFWC